LPDDLRSLTYALLVTGGCAYPGPCGEKTARSGPNLAGLDSENAVRLAGLAGITAAVRGALRLNYDVRYAPGMESSR
jgi:hypothetical protein